MDEVKTAQCQVKMAYRLVVTAELTPDEEEGGYSVYCPELDIYTQGETVEEAIANLREAAEGTIEVVGLDGLGLRPKPAIRKEVELTVYA
ncbi:MAG TPA: type II toxin-antitoxin system HicB family antitoxin [Anaerolineae bacterium]|nr:type II toxin-antitoxin system HicB family antitoxin [Anaerolineae bacterium]